MKFTFGITTTKEPQRMSRNTNNHIREMIDAIRVNEIPEDSYEIIIVGGDNKYQNDNDVTHFEFDDINPRPGWFTRKKNMITENAKFDNIVFSHDYIRLDKDWYKGFLKFGDDWDICMCIHKAIEGHRFRDWLAWDDPDICYNIDGYSHRIALVPYSYTKTKYMQISGFWWTAKKSVMEQDPLDENLAWGDAEDVEWSMRIRDKYKYVMNTNSIVEVLRPNKKLSSYYLEGDKKYEDSNWINEWKL
jgi:hypothetical protein|tara:strand:- start:292 stop:1029 length:738 start_codon:yes stop_codon:yes gene_type:complete